MTEIIVTTPEAIKDMLFHFKQEMVQEFRNILAADKKEEDPDEEWDGKNVAQHFGISPATVHRHREFFGAYHVGRSVRYSSKFIKQLKLKNKFRK